MGWQRNIHPSISYIVCFSFLFVNNFKSMRRKLKICNIAFWQNMWTFFVFMDLRAYWDNQINFISNTSIKQSVGNEIYKCMINMQIINILPIHKLRVPARFAFSVLFSCAWVISRFKGSRRLLVVSLFWKSSYLRSSCVRLTVR
jgi:hypothetical protein